MTTKLENHQDAKDLAVGAGLNLLGMVAKISKVAFVFVAARYYGTGALGLYLLAWAAVDISSKLGLWGMDRSLIRDIARHTGDGSEATKDKIFGLLRFNISMVLGLSLVTASVLFTISPFVAERVFGEPELTAPIRLLAIALPAVALTHVLISTTKALRQMQYEVLIRQTLEPLTLFLVACLLVPMDLGVRGLALSHLVASVIAAGSAFIVVFHKYRYLGWRKTALSPGAKWQIIRYTSPLALMDLLNQLVVRADIMLVGAILNSNSAGLYGIAVEIISVIKRIRQGFEPIFSPIVAELSYKKQFERLKRNYVLVTRWLLAGSLLPVIAMLLFPAQILGFFSVESHAVAVALMVLALAHGLFSVFSASESILIMTGRTMLNAALALLMFVVNCVVTTLLIRQFGLAGAAFGTLMAFLIVSVARLYFVHRQLQVHPFTSALLWPIATASITAILFYLVRNWLTIDSTPKTIMVLAAMAVTYAAIYFSRATEPEEKEITLKVLAKLKHKPAILRA